MWAGRQMFDQKGASKESLSFLAAASYDPLPVGGIAVALMLGTYTLLDLSLDVPLLILAASGTTLIYLLDRASELSPEDEYHNPARLRWVRRHRGYLGGLAGAMSLCGLATLLFLRPSTLLVGGLLGGIGISYGLPILPGGRRLKSFAPLKPFLVAIPWAVGAVVLPVIEAGASLSVGAVALTGYRACWVLPNVLLAEWSDRLGEDAVGINESRFGSFSKRLRERASIWVGIGFFGALAGVGWGGGRTLLLIDAIGLLFLLAGVWQLRPDRKPEHAFLADLLVAWPIVTAVVGWMRL